MTLRRYSRSYRQFKLTVNNVGGILDKNLKRSGYKRGWGRGRESWIAFLLLATTADVTGRVNQSRMSERARRGTVSSIERFNPVNLKALKKLEIFPKIVLSIVVKLIRRFSTTASRVNSLLQGAQN